MDIFTGSGVVMEMEVAAEEVVTQDPEEEQAGMDDMGLLSTSNSEQLYYPGDSSEDEYNSGGHGLPELTSRERHHMKESCLKDDCLCWECGKHFQSLDMLMQHLLTHKAQVRCNICRVTFRQMVSLSMHLENVHNNVVLFCTACCQPFKNKWDFNKHLEQHANIKLLPLSPESFPKSHTVMGDLLLPGGAAKLDCSETEAQLPPSKPGENSVDSSQDTLLPALVAKDHAYNNRSNSCENGMLASSYALRMRHKKKVTKVFRQKNMPDSSHQKKITFYVFRSVDQNQKELHKREQGANNEEVKPDPSSLIPPLPESTDLLGNTNPSQLVKQEDVEYDRTAPMWEGAPIEEDDEQEEPRSGNYSDGGDSESARNSVSDSDYNPGDLSDSSTESFSSGNSSGSSYCPPQSRVRKSRTKGIMRTTLGKKQPDAMPLPAPVLASTPVPAPRPVPAPVPIPALAPGHCIITGESTKCPRCGKGPYDLPRNLQQHIAACNKKVAVCSVCNAFFPDDIALMDHKVRIHPSIKPSRMYACESCREVFPQQVIYRHHNCSLKATSKIQVVNPESLTTPGPTSVSNITPNAAPTLSSSLSSSKPTTEPSTVVTSPVHQTVISTVANVEPVLSNQSVVTMPSSNMGSSSVTVREAVHNPTPISPVTLSGSSAFPLPGIMLSSSAPTCQSGSMPLMATVVFSGNNTVARMARVVLQSQSLTFPSATSTQTVSQKQPVGPSSLPSQNKTTGQTQPLPSVQITNLLLRGLIQPHTLLKSTQPPAPTAVSLPRPLPITVRLPNPTQIPVPLSNSVPVSVACSNAGPVSIVRTNLSPVSVVRSNPAPMSVFRSNPAPVSVVRSNPAPVSVVRSNPAPVSVVRSNPAPASVVRANPAPASVVRANPAPASVVRANPAPASVVCSNPAPASVVRTNPAPVSIVRSNAAPVSIVRSNPAPVPVGLSNPALVPIGVSKSAPVPVRVCNPASVSVTHCNPGPVSVSLSNPGPVSVALSNTGPVSVPRSNAGPVSVPRSNAGPVSVAVSNPDMVSAPHSYPGSVSVPCSNPDTVSVTSCNPGPVSVPVCNPAPVFVPHHKQVAGTVPLCNSTPLTLPVSLLAPTPSSVPFPIVAPDVSTQTSSVAREPLKIVGLYVNCSQELALQQRLKKSWRSKGIFLCRQCGAISRQPSLSVRHRYLHRGSRQHRCHCGRTFLRQLHLLRHHVQHAEATRFVCAPCGQTFSGASGLARHKQGQADKGCRKRRRRVRKDCLAPFSCDCGQLFQRPTAFLWHKLKNHKSLKQFER